MKACKALNFTPIFVRSNLKAFLIKPIQERKDLFYKISYGLFMGYCGITNLNKFLSLKSNVKFFLISFLLCFSIEESFSDPKQHQQKFSLFSLNARS